MLDNRQEDGPAHGSKHEKRRESHVILQEIGKVVVIKENEKEGDDGDEDDEDQGIEKGTFELLGGGIGGGLEVDEIGGGANWGGGERVGGGEGIHQQDDEKHTD